MKSNLEKKLTEYFETHPEATIVFVGLGVLFTDLEKAKAYCGGTSGKPITFTREQVELLDDAAAGDELSAWAAEQEKTADETPADAGNDVENTSILDEKPAADMDETPVEVSENLLDLQGETAAPVEETTAAVEEEATAPVEKETPVPAPTGRRKRN